jgi:hypothetical protein
MKSGSKLKATIQKGANVMDRIHPLVKSSTVAKTAVPALLICPHCNVEMGLLGIESETETRDLYTFECNACGALEVRGVLVRQ